MEKEGGFLYEPLSWSQKLINKASPFFLEGKNWKGRALGGLTDKK